MEPNRPRFWNVRAIPTDAICSVLSSRRFRPSSVMAPESGSYRRLMQLNNVVLPAPFGPIRPQIWPCRRSNEGPSSATTPPKRSRTSRTARKESSGAARCSCAVVPIGSLTLEDVTLQLPGGPVEGHHLDLRGEVRVVGRGLHGDAGQEEVGRDAGQALSRVEHVLAGAAVHLLQDVDHDLRDGVAVRRRRVGGLDVALVLLRELLPGLHALVVGPARV